jgi:mono/diheme cytochrome c family protein
MRLAKDFKLALIAVAITLAVTACATQDKQTTQDANPTRAIFQRQCAVCHGRKGEGQQIGTLSVPALSAGRPASDSDERLFAQISNGGNGMPSFKFSLTDEQIKDLIRFVREDIQGRAASKQ